MGMSNRLRHAGDELLQTFPNSKNVFRIRTRLPSRRGKSSKTNHSFTGKVRLGLIKNLSKTGWKSISCNVFPTILSEPEAKKMQEGTPFLCCNAFYCITFWKFSIWGSSRCKKLLGGKSILYFIAFY